MQTIKRFITENPLVVVIIVAVITLIIAGSSIYFTSLPKIPALIIPTPTPSIAVIKNLEKSIIVYSQREDYTVSFLNQDNLKIILNGLKFWEKNPAAHLIISLSAKPQGNVYKNSLGEQIFSYSISFREGVALLNVYVFDPSIKKPNVSGLFGSAVVYALTEASDQKPSQLLTTPEIASIFKISKALPRSITHPSSTSAAK